MTIDNILCPVDFSRQFAAALTHATALARRHAATLHFVYVYEPIFANVDMAGVPMQPLPADLEPLRERLETIRPSAPGIDCRHEIIFGLPASSVVSYAATHDIDLIIVGTHGRTGPSRLLMGSVAEAIVRFAACPVLTVHGSHSLIVDTADETVDTADETVDTADETVDAADETVDAKAESDKSPGHH